ncbi:hypothetical protein PSN45_002162 [Yamadazyma tenuis]|uniref:uncharacterized protein n=1 Tax=Candida tenuis TaxID=2315449 RepID=UPI0027A84DA8|nr:hypothetical protein PSN45_002162 [Yamadazyma tenuis]
MKRSVTTTEVSELIREDIKRRFTTNLVEIPSRKVTRSKSSSFIPGLSYCGNETEEEEIDIPQSQLVENSARISLPYPDSGFNGTLISADSAENGSSTVIIRPKSFTFPSLPHPENTEPFPLINEVSPMSESLASTTSFAKHETIDEMLQNYPQPRSATGLLNPFSGDSILNPLRGKPVPPRDSLFKEPSALLTDSGNEDKKEEERAPSAGTSKASDIPIDSSPASHTSWAFPLMLIFNLIYIIGITISICILAGGTRNVTFRYFKNLQPSARGEILHQLNEMYPIEAEKVVSVEVASSGLEFELEAPIFSGISYSPLDSMEPHCGSNPADIEADLKLLSKATRKVRSYGLQCNQSEYILDAIIKSKLNMTLSMGVWIGEDDKINTQQLEIMKKVLTKYPRKMFDSVFVGNEVLFRQDKTTNELIEIIQDVKHFVKKIGYFDLPVGTSEIGSLIDGRLLQACDIVGANIHPFFGGIDVSMATDWTYDFLKYQIEPINKSHKTKLVITEVGWPYRGGRYEGSVANATNFQYFMNAWLCESQK